MPPRPLVFFTFLFLTACQGPVKLTDHWEVGRLETDATQVFGATLDGIRRVGRDGSAPALLVPYRTAVFEESQHRPDRIAVDEEYVYWTQQAATPGVDAVRRVRKTGGRVQSVLRVQSDSQSGALELRVDADFVFVLSYGRGPYGNPVTDTAAGYAGGCILRVRKSDGEIVELAGSIRAGSGLALDESYAYWSESGTYRPTVSGLSDYIYNMDGRILRIKKGGGTIETVAAGLDNPRELRAEEGRLRFRGGFHYERNSRSADLGYFEIDPSGGRPRKLGPRPFFTVAGRRIALRTEPYGYERPGGRHLHYYLEREDAQGVIEQLYATDEDIVGLTVDRGEAFWLQGTSYAVMKLKLD